MAVLLNWINALVTPRTVRYTIVYLYETAAFFGIGMQNLFTAWNLNKTLDIENLFTLVMEEIFLFILVLPFICGCVLSRKTTTYDRLE